MKHFHINDEKKRLAHEIFNETKLLEEQENERAGLVHRITYEKDMAYSESFRIQRRLRELKISIANYTHKIEDLQRRHDQIKD